MVRFSYVVSFFPFFLTFFFLFFSFQLLTDYGLNVASGLGMQMRMPSVGGLRISPTKKKKKRYAFFTAYCLFFWCLTYFSICSQVLVYLLLKIAMSDGRRRVGDANANGQEGWGCKCEWVGGLIIPPTKQKLEVVGHCGAWQLQV